MGLPHTPQNSSQVFMRYSVDVDFVCENEFFNRYGESPTSKRWISFYNRKEKVFFNAFEKQIKEMTNKFGAVQSKDSLVMDLHPSSTESENRFKIPNSLEKIFLFEKSHTLISILKDYDSNFRVLIQSDSEDNEVMADMLKWCQRSAKKYCIVHSEERNPTISIIASGANGLKTIDFTIKKFGDEIETMLDDHYNDDFRAFAEHISQKIENGSHGIVLLHGEPGTGKTNFIRYLANSIKKKEMIYIPPDLVNVLTQPSFVEFVMSNKDKIFIVEDAESVIETRENVRSSAINNILNLCDGLIGEAVRAHFICTFNCDFNKIDPALKRPGRMVGEYEFKKLSVEKSNFLGKKLFNGEFETSKPMTLAEIYNFKTAKFVVGEETNKKYVGLKLDE